MVPIAFHAAEYSGAMARASSAYDVPFHIALGDMTLSIFVFIFGFVGDREFAERDCVRPRQREGGEQEHGRDNPTHGSKLRRFARSYNP